MTTPELVAATQREREERVESDRLARLVTSIPVCCSPTLAERIMRALRGVAVSL